jgi:hypothetical protein
MNRWQLLSVSGVALTLATVFSCSPERNFSDAPGGGGAAATASQGGAAGEPGGGSPSHAGTDSPAAGASGVSGGGMSAAAGSPGENGGAPGQGGSTANGGDGAEIIAGAAGMPTTDCPKNSCCLPTGTLARDAVNPSNPCQSCQPHRSIEDWSDLNAQLCKTASGEGLSAKKELHQTKSCGEGGCTDVLGIAPDAEQMLVITPTSEIDNLLLDFSNLNNSSSIGLTKAVVRFSVKVAGPARSVKILTNGVEVAACTHVLSSKTYTSWTCDITTAVKSWMQAPASAERSVTIATTSAGNPMYVQTYKAASAADRPLLLLDYSASCEGDKCVGIAH